MFNLPQFQPISLDDSRIRNLFESTMDSTIRDFTLNTVRPETNKIMQELEMKFPVSERKKMIEKEIIPNLPDSVWGENEAKILFDKFLIEINKRKIKLRGLEPYEYISSLRKISSDLNLKKEAWTSYITYMKDYKIISMFLEISSVLNYLKEKCDEWVGKISIGSRGRNVQKVLRVIDMKLLYMSLIFIRIFSIIEKISVNNVEKAFKEMGYLSFEKLYLE